MKFLIAPEYDRPYDMRIAHGLGDALAAAGHSYLILPAEGATPDAVNRCCDIAFGVNRPRPEWLKKDILYIAWIQDYRPGQDRDYAGRARSNDLIYTIGSEQWIGFANPGPCFRGSLLVGIEPELLEAEPIEQTLDFSICGYIPLPFTKIDQTQYGYRCFKTLESFYKPLTGSSNAIIMAKAMQEFVDQLVASENIPESEQFELRQQCNWLSIEYPRYIDRLRMAQLAYFVSSKCAFYGVNWRKYYQFGGCVFAPINEPKKLLDIYRSSKINLHCNWNGFGLHHRVLEVMALGGFIMAHSCADPQAAGRLTTCFEPDVHFGEYTPDDFVVRSQYWLENDDARYSAGQEARKIVASQHLWKHRVQQIMKDLH